MNTKNDNIAEVEKIKVYTFRRLIRFEGSFELSTKIKTHKVSSILKDWVELIVKEEFYDPSLPERLSELEIL